MLKCSSERWVWAPHSLSAGTSTTPRLSVSFLMAIIWSLPAISAVSAHPNAPSQFCTAPVSARPSRIPCGELAAVRVPRISIGSRVNWEASYRVISLCREVHRVSPRGGALATVRGRVTASNFNASNYERQTLAASKSALRSANSDVSYTQASAVAACGREFVEAPRAGHTSRQTARDRFAMALEATTGSRRGAGRKTIPVSSTNSPDRPSWLPVPLCPLPASSCRNDRCVAGGRCGCVPPPNRRRPADASGVLLPDGPRVAEILRHFVADYRKCGYSTRTSALSGRCPTYWHQAERYITDKM